MRILDSHCHLQDPAFDEDREKVWAAARREAIGMVVPGYSLESSAAAVEFATGHDEAWALIGVHPHDAKDLPSDWMDRLKVWAASPKVVGIGEIGLDYHYNLSPPEVQRRVFAQQLSLARDLALPVAIHSREAWDDTLSMMHELAGPAKGVLHCFTGDAGVAERVLAQDFFLSFSGILTFPKAIALKEAARHTPPDRALIETDAPYLAPVPHRGHRNQPLWVLEVATTLGALWGREAEWVFMQTLENGRSLFPNITKY